MIEIMLDIAAVCFTLAVMFLAPLIYYLVVGQFKSPTATERAQRAKLTKRNKVLK